MTPRRVRLALTVLAGLGALAGVWAFRLHFSTDRLADVRADCDAGARLNAGLPLYPANQDVNGPTAHFYPPLFALWTALSVAILVWLVRPWPWAGGPVAFGAWKDRRWLVPVAVWISLPVVWINSWVILLAAMRLRGPRSESVAPLPA